MMAKDLATVANSIVTLIKTRDLAYRMGRHIRNTDEIPATRWAVQGMDLLAELQRLDPGRYEREIKKKRQSDSVRVATWTHLLAEDGVTEHILKEGSLTIYRCLANDLTPLNLPVEVQEYLSRILEEGGKVLNSADSENCNCELHRMTKEDRADLFDRAIDKTNAEILANGGVLPDEIYSTESKS